MGVFLVEYSCSENCLVTRKNIKEKNFVLAVIKSDISDFIRGKIETKAQFLAMRFALRSCWRPLQVTKCFSLIFTYGS